MKSVTRILRRYSTVGLGPLIAGGLIYADWSHTKAWKAEKEAKKLQPLKVYV